jgi:hypothetical protein
MRNHACFLLLIAALASAGCGMLADKNNIRIAKIDGENITRGDLNSYIRSFPENERPQIRNHGDLLSVLNRMIDERIKARLVEEQGQNLPSMVSRDAAREQFFQSLGDEQEQYRAAWGMEVPADGQSTPLMEVYQLTPEGLASLKDYIETRTDALYNRIRGDEVLALMVRDKVQRGEIELDEKALELEYKFRQSDLQRPESITFTGIRFEATAQGAEKAAAVLSAMNGGEPFEAAVQRNQAENPASIVSGTLTRDANSARFESFWAQLSGAAVGTIAGPLFMPETQQVAIDPDGKQRPVVQPPSYMVCRVDAREDERVLTLAESKPILAPPLLIGAMMRELRAQHGVELYEDNLADPSEFSGGASKPMA